MAKRNNIIPTNRIITPRINYAAGSMFITNRAEDVPRYMGGGGKFHPVRRVGKRSSRRRMKNY